MYLHDAIHRVAMGEWIKRSDRADARPDYAMMASK
jgi:hypothetical protein